MIKEVSPLIAINLKEVNCSGYNPKSWELIEQIKNARPASRGYAEISLQRLDLGENSTILVQWYGSKNGKWYALSDIFYINDSNNWVRVEDSLPDAPFLEGGVHHSAEMLVYSHGLELCYYYPSGQYWEDVHGNVHTVTHWQIPPSAPKK